jgi:hypothetical protein
MQNSTEHTASTTALAVEAMLENRIEKTLKNTKNDFSKNHHVCIAI